MTVDDSPVKEAREAVAAAREQGNRLGEARALFELGSILSGLERSEEARAVFDELEPIGRELVGPAEQGVVDARDQGDRRAEANALFALSHVLRDVGRPDEAAHAADQAKQTLREWIELYNHEHAEKARQTAAQAIATAREHGDRRAEADALLTLSHVLRKVDRGDEAARAAEQGIQINREQFELENRKRAEKARQTAAQAIATAREHGDRRAEADALLALSHVLRKVDRGDEAARADEQAMQITRERRARERLESAAQAACAAQARGDRAAEALALLTLGQALALLERSVEAEAHFTQAEQLTYGLIAATKRAGADQGHRTESLTELRTLVTLGKALRDAGRDDIAGRISEQANQVDLSAIDVAIRTAVQAAEGNQAVSNHVADTSADSVIQVGVLHGDLTIHTGPRRPVEALQVSVTTIQEETTTYKYDGWERHHSDVAVHVFVEAFTAQAVILRQLRPVVVRRIDRFDVVRSGAMSVAASREFRVGLDVPPDVGLDLQATRYGAGLDRQALNLDRAFAAGMADFPFYVTASDPEYFVIVPERHRTAGLIEWRLELDWSCLGQHGTITIDHGHRPFLSA
ncbi:hypothetical protein AB5J72_50205 [Streptomyces sp. CG1]|uniref:hypothetical protein n=1 Tax=Streptomyces sp. CG1 TaxID=1287523 RepID=UPI0034E22DDC